MHTLPALEEQAFLPEHKTPQQDLDQSDKPSAWEAEAGGSLKVILGYTVSWSKFELNEDVKEERGKKSELSVCPKMQENWC